MATYAEEIYIYNNGTGSYPLANTLYEDIGGDSISFVDTLAYKTYNSANVPKYCVPYGVISSASNVTFWYQDIDLTLATNPTLKFYFIPKLYISEFSWTDDDTAKIKKGEPITNMTAAAWNDLVSKVIILRPLAFSWRKNPETAEQGGNILGSNFLNMQSALESEAATYDATWARAFLSHQMKYRGSAGTMIPASIIANHEYSLKNAVNKLIQIMRP